MRLISFFLLASVSLTCFINNIYGGETKVEIRYVPIGDSYTIGEGTFLERSWPALLVKHLQASGIHIKLLTNPSKTGWTTQNAIDYELPIYESLRPTFATLLIGVNDWVQGVDIETFRQRLAFLLDKMLEILPQKDHLLLVTIPDFSATPKGAMYGRGRNISSGIAEFNKIIIKEAKGRGLTVVDIFPISQNMKENFSLISHDGLHPSGKEYGLWEELIYKEAYKILSKSTK